MKKLNKQDEDIMDKPLHREIINELDTKGIALNNKITTNIEKSEKLEAEVNKKVLGINKKIDER